MSPRISRDFFNRSSAWALPQRYLGATALVLLAWLVCLLIRPVSLFYSYLLFECAIAIAAVIFARGSSIWATLLSAFIAVYFFVSPTHTFVLSDRDGEAFFIFLASALLISAAGESVRNQLERLQDVAEKERLRERQKDAMLRELSHRTRNNLHLIVSAISLQMLRAATPEARDSLQAALDRTQGVARVDALLQSAGESDVVDAREYLSALAEDIRASLVVLHPIDLAFQAEPYPLTREIATALGIAVNELVTNALKYAFPHGQSGRIGIVFHARDNDLVLIVEDNGKGYAEATGAGTGTRLIGSLVGWWGGTMTREDARPGCRVTVRIPKQIGTTTKGK